MKRISKLLAFFLAALMLFSTLPVTVLAAEAAPSARVMCDTVDWKGKNTDLTEIGPVDWIFPGRSGSIADFAMQDRKAVGGQAANVLSFEYLEKSNTWNHFWDVAGTSFSWSDGLNKESAFGQSGYQDVLLGFYGDTSETQILHEDVGWVVKVPADKEVQVLTLITGAVWAGYQLQVFANGEETPVHTESVDSDDSGSGFFWKHTITISGNTSVEVRCLFNSHGVGPDMITLAGAGLARIPMDPDTDYTALLRDSADIARAWLGEDIDSGIRESLVEELSYVGPLLEDPALTNEAAYSAYQFLKLALDAAEAAPRGGDYAPVYAPDNTAILGFTGDKNAPTVYMDGSVALRAGVGTVVNFGVADLDPDDILWTRMDGGLPGYVSQYAVGDLSHTVEVFADEVSIAGKSYEIVYGRMTTVNGGSEIKLLPIVSAEFIPLDGAGDVKVVKPGETVTRDWAVYADSMGGRYVGPDNADIAAAGSLDDHYAHMEGYWADRLGDLPQFDLPGDYAFVDDAVKAAYVDALIAADSSELHAGENTKESDAYQEQDAISILSALVQLGDTRDFAAYAGTILSKIPEQAVGQVPIPFAIYLQKTWDYLTVADYFADRGRTPGLMTCAHKSQDQTGLLAYAYLCEQLLKETGSEIYQTELDWARQTLSDLPETALTQADQLLPGSNPWAAWLFGASRAEGVDASYSALLKDELNLSVGEAYSTAANAGYFSAALLGEAYRDRALQAYQWMAGHTMTAPYVWAQSISENGTGTGAAPHVTGELASVRAVLDSFLAEKSDGVLVIGRGIPAMLTIPGSHFSVSNILCNAGQRVGYTVDRTQTTLVLTFTGDLPQSPVRVELPCLKGSTVYYTTAGVLDAEAGVLELPAGTVSVEIGLSASSAERIQAVIRAIDAIGPVTRNSGELIQTARSLYDALTDGEKTQVTNYEKLTAAEATYAALLSYPGTPASPVPSDPAPSGDKKTETVKAEDGTVTETVTEKNGTVTKTVTTPEGKKIQSVVVPGEGKTITVTRPDGTIAAKLTLPAELPAAAAFSDVGKDYWAHKSIMTVTALGLFKGTGDGAFSPELPLSRGMLVTTLYRLSGSVPANGTARFVDVADDAWYAAPAAWSSENDLVLGDDVGRFAPNEELSREMLIAILYRYAGFLGMDTTASEGALNGASDRAQVSAWAVPAMNWAAERGLLVDHGGRLMAGSSAPRAEVAAILANFIDLLST